MVERELWGGTCGGGPVGGKDCGLVDVKLCLRGTCGREELWASGREGLWIVDVKLWAGAGGTYGPLGGGGGGALGGDSSPHRGGLVNGSR